MGVVSRSEKEEKLCLGSEKLEREDQASKSKDEEPAYTFSVPVSMGRHTACNGRVH